jgi:sulfoxide reductase heme-binding subunit YedZ
VAVPGGGPPVPRLQRALRHAAAKPLLVLLLAAPGVALLVSGFTDRLGPNPAEALLRGTGDWTLRLLLLTLAITPLRHWTGWHVLARFRRTVGVTTFFYAALHALAYAWLDMGAVWADILRDIPRRPFILVGTLALLGLLVLAATSFDRVIRAMGAARWQALHRAVYGIAVLALLHFFWMRSAKNDFVEVAVYAAVFAVLMLARWHRRPTRPSARR